jgi:hypothetical protein
MSGSSTQQQQATHDLLISNQVSKGFEQLASDKITERLGGIYALEGVMNTSDQYHQPVLEALCAFVRESTTRQKGPRTVLLEAFTTPRGGTAGNTSDKLSNDIQAALTVIGRRNPGTEKVDLAEANIPSANMIDANNLSGANLNGAKLVEANLIHAKLAGADLSRAYLGNADLSRANLTDAHNLTQAQLDQACGKPMALPPGLTLDKPCPPRPGAQ